MKKLLAVAAAALVVLLAYAIPERLDAARIAARDNGASQRIRAHVRFLADDALEGRLAGTRGYDLAANYVAAQFEAFGLAPGGPGDSWFQSLQLVEASAVIPAAEIVLHGPTGDQALVVSDDFLPQANTNAAESSSTAPLVFVGFGIRAPALNYDDFANIDLRGKIAVVIGGAPDRFASIERAHYSAGLTKFAELTKRGAVGVLSFATPADSARFPWAKAVQASWRPRMRWLNSQGVAADSFPELQDVFSLSPAGAAKLFAQAPKSLQEIFANAQSGSGQAFDLPLTASLKRRTLLGRRTSANVLGLLRGRDPKLADEVVVVTAHLDHLGKGAPIGGDAIYNGAVDNASGIGVLLEVARALSAGPRPRRSVLFVGLTGEESGLLGSDYLARNPPIPNMRFVTNVNIDMPVMLTEIADLVAFGAEHSSLGAVAARAAKAEGIALAPDPMPEETIFVRSDQYSFVRQGVPAIYLEHGVGSAVRLPPVNTRALVDGFLRDHYHQPSDQIDLPIHYPSLARLARVDAAIVAEVANASGRPQWAAGSFLGAMFAPAAAR